jgi:hypothetical protein
MKEIKNKTKTETDKGCSWKLRERTRAVKEVKEKKQQAWPRTARERAIWLIACGCEWW